MFFSFSKKVVLLSVFCLMLIGSQTVLAGDDWREITTAELSMKKPKVEPDADAEVLFWEVRVDDSSDTNLVMKHYIRVKIFTENGREKYSKVDIPFSKRMKIKDIEARIIKPDGSIVELTKDDVFEREIAKANKVKIKAKSFAVPNIETGVIVEYRYKEVIKNSSASNMRMMFQHDVPIQTISYYFKPYASTKYYTFNMEDNKFIKDKGGYYRATMTNVPALKEEPRMPPEDEVRSWLLLYYAPEKETSSDFWSRTGYVISKGFDIKDTLKADKDIKRAAAEIVGSATSPEDQIAKIYEFCQTKVKNITFDPTMTDEQKEELKENKSASDTYKKMQGTDEDINQLFASLVSGLGHEARLAFGGDKSDKFFNPRQAHLSFIHFGAIAVKVNGLWKFYDPGNPFITYGMLPWYEEDTAVLLLGYKDYITTTTTISDQTKSVAKRSAKLKLLEDGTLEGDVRIEYTGHLSYQEKLRNYDDSQNQREENLKESVKENLSTAELSAINIENIQNPEKPIVFNYKVRVPNYAQVVGKRMFFQPGFFTQGEKPMFSSESREYDVFFQFPWSEQDDVEIALPEGFQLDNAEAPSGISDAQKISGLDIVMTINKEKNVLNYKRNFYFGGKGVTLFRTDAYPAIKNLFDTYNKANTHSLALKKP